MRLLWMMVVGMLCVGSPALGQQPPGKNAAAIEATKETQRAVLRGLHVLPRTQETDRLNLDEAIQDWSLDGRITAARITSGKTEMTGAEPGVMSLASLKPLTALQNLELTAVAVPDLKPLGALPKLRELRVTNCAKLKTIADLATARALTRLHVENAPLGTAAALKGLTNLTELALPGDGLKDAAFLAGLPRLERLDLSRNPQLTDIKAIAKLAALKYVDLSQTGVQDLGPLADLANLQTLRIPKGLNLKPIEGLRGSGVAIEEL